MNPYDLSLATIEQLVEQHGTPIYIVSRKKLVENYRLLDNALPGVHLHYAMKANPHEGILRALVNIGAGFDVASKGEIQAALLAGANPRDIKFKLGEEIIARFHDQAAAVKARENFIARFRKGAMPDDIEEVTLTVPEDGMLIANVLKEAGLVSSTSDGMRMLKQGAVKIDGERVEDKSLRLPAGTQCICQVGKRRFARVTLAG